LLKSSPVSDKWNDWTWAFIAIIISPVLGLDYPERVRCAKKRSTFEFRLKMHFEEFVDATASKQTELLFAQLHRSVDLMTKWRVGPEDRGELHHILNLASSDVTSRTHSKSLTTPASRSPASPSGSP
jgi:hypothetical protein